MNNNIGALWAKKGKNGEFFTGNIELENGEKLQVVVFRNNKKEKENQPDYNILKSTIQVKEEKQEEVTYQDDLPF